MTYLKLVLTVIAAALVYLCVIFTPLPGVSAQAPSAVPGVSSGPTEVVIVGFKQTRPWETQFALPVSLRDPVQVTAAKPLPITGQVTTERSSNVADRVILVGWEENARRDRVMNMEHLDDSSLDAAFRGVPVRTPK